jgi:aminoglycoside 2'-N-acetyltransferase I
MASSEEQFVTCSSEELLLLAPSIRVFLNEAYEGDFSDSDYENALGGRHFMIVVGSHLIAHASVVTRSISIDDSAWKVGYVEAVAVASDFRDRGLGRQIMQQVTDFCRGNYEVAMLSTGEHGFYERFGWVRLDATTFVDTANGLVRTDEDDDCLMLLSDMSDLTNARRVVALDRSENPW